MIIKPYIDPETIKQHSEKEIYKSFFDLAKDERTKDWIVY